jgi:hypothetical protein
MNLGVSYLNYDNTNFVLVAPGLRYVTRAIDVCTDNKLYCLYDTSVNYLDLTAEFKLNTRQLSEQRIATFYPYLGFAIAMKIDGERMAQDLNYFMLYGFDLVMLKRVSLGIEYNVGIEYVTPFHLFKINTLLFNLGWIF